jgi:RimJ/RimL family protein N-acetyltransferase
VRQLDDPAHGSAGKRPVWGSLEENPASWRLARKLGFVVVDEIVLFELS